MYPSDIFIYMSHRTFGKLKVGSYNISYIHIMLRTKNVLFLFGRRKSANNVLMQSPFIIMIKYKCLACKFDKIRL